LKSLGVNAEISAAIPEWEDLEIYMKGFVRVHTVNVVMLI